MEPLYTDTDAAEVMPRTAKLHSQLKNGTNVLKYLWKQCHLWPIKGTRYKKLMNKRNV